MTTSQTCLWLTLCIVLGLLQGWLVLSFSVLPCILQLKGCWESGFPLQKTSKQTKQQQQQKTVLVVNLATAHQFAKISLRYWSILNCLLVCAVILLPWFFCGFPSLKIKIPVFLSNGKKKAVQQHHHNRLLRNQTTGRATAKSQVPFIHKN